MGLKQILLVTKDAIIALFTAIIIMGGVTLGWFTATESAAIACIYAFLISMFVYKKLKWKDIPRILGNVVNTLCLSFSLIAAAGAFGYVLAFLKVPALLTNFLLSITDNRIILLLLINLMLLCLGCIMDMAPIIFIVTPILLPVVTALGMSLNEVAPMITMDEHNRSADLLVISKATMDKLTDEQMAAIQEAADESSLYQRELWAESEKESREECIEKGCTIIDLTDEERQQFMDAVKELNATEGEKYSDIFEKIEAMK